MIQGYLVLVYVLLIVIRFVLVFGLYPVTSRIGIGTNVKESIFMSYAGFRGTVGIALALSLNSTGEWLRFYATTNILSDLIIVSSQCTNIAQMKNCNKTRMHCLLWLEGSLLWLFLLMEWQVDPCSVRYEQVTFFINATQFAQANIYILFTA